MSPIIITPVDTLKFRTQYDTLSNYAQRYIKSQIKGISFALEKFFQEFDSERILKNEQLLKEIGFKQIGRDIEEGIILSGDKCDYHVYLSKNKLGFEMVKSEQAYRRYLLDKDSNEYSHAGSNSTHNIEDEISEIIDFVDKKLAKAKSIDTRTNTPQFFLPRPEISKTIELLNRTRQRLPKGIAIKDYGYISSKDKKLANLITEKFKTTLELYKKISEGHTRSKAKSAYPNYIPQEGTGKLKFKNIGPFGEDIGLFFITHNKANYLAVEITNRIGKEFKFVISEDNGTIQRNLPYRFSVSGSKENRLYSIPDYYTQKEIDESNLHTYLSCLNSEMELFEQHSKNWINKWEQQRLIRLNNDIASIEPYKELLDDVHSGFDNYRTKIRKYLRKNHKRKQFKAENNISAQLTSTAVRFENITPEGYDLRLSYPKVHDKNATQLLVMQGDEIKKSFYIYDNKLLRFNIKDLNDKFQNCCYNLYYYDNKYLQESDFEKYFSLVRDKLHDLNQKLDNIREKQLANKEKYHIKSPKEK